MHGGGAALRASRYLLKFLVLAINARILSSTSLCFVGTPPHVRLRRRIGAVPSAEMIAVSEEKLFKNRHFCRKD